MFVSAPHISACPLGWTHADSQWALPPLAGCQGSCYRAALKLAAISGGPYWALGPECKLRACEQIGRQAFATMNYFHRKTYLQLLEQRETALLQQRQRMDQLRWDRHRTSIANDSDVGATDLASPGTVLGNSDAVTPQALARA